MSSLHCLNTEVNSQLSAIVNCSDEQFEELLEVYSHTSIDGFKKWFAENYVEEDWFKTPLYVVYVNN